MIRKRDNRARMAPSTNPSHDTGQSIDPDDGAALHGVEPRFGQLQQGWHVLGDQQLGAQGEEAEKPQQEGLRGQWTGQDGPHRHRGPRK